MNKEEIYIHVQTLTRLRVAREIVGETCNLYEDKKRPILTRIYNDLSRLIDDGYKVWGDFMEDSDKKIKIKYQIKFGEYTISVIDEQLKGEWNLRSNEEHAAFLRERVNTLIYGDLHQCIESGCEPELEEFEVLEDE